MLRSFALSVLFLTLCAGAAPGQRADPVSLARLSGPIELDGHVDEPAWESVAPFPLVMLEPTFGEPPSERTEIRVAYDDAYIYASLRAYDADPSGIRVNSLYRDRTSGDDLFVLFLDTFNDNENGVSFTINPAGMRRDAAIASDASGPNGLNSDYNTFWDVRTQTTAEGWFAELRVPFSSLRFQDRDGRVEMGLIAFRLIQRKNERVTYPALAPAIDRAFIKPSLAQKVVLEGVYARRPLHLTAYGTGGFDQAFPRPGGDPLPSDRVNREVGLDLKYGLTTNLTVDLTVNTDFAQVEADDQQVNLTRFSLFFPEKREFFQERAGIFDFRTGRDSRLFHSRRIGLTETGEPVRILGGARAIGRLGAWDVGFLDMQTAAVGPLPSENFGVLRLRRQVFNPYSYAGGITTTRIGQDGRYNVAYGLDGVFRLWGDDYLTALWAQSVDRDSAGLGPRMGLDAGRLAVDLERRGRNGFGYRSAYNWSGRDYDPGVGFVRRRDFTLLDQTLSYTWLPGGQSPLIWHQLAVQGEVFLRNADRSVESAEVGPEWSFSGKSGSSGSVAAKVLQEDLLVPFRISSGAVVPAGRYVFPQLAASYEMARGKLLRTGAGITAGSFYDGWRTSLTLSPVWNVSRHLELGGSYGYDRVQFPERDQSFQGHLLRLKVGAAMDTRLSAQSLLQFNSGSHAASANLRVRYNFREGNDLWLVLNEGLNTERPRLEPALPLTESRALLLKYTHTFQM